MQREIERRVVVVNNLTGLCCIAETAHLYHFFSPQQQGKHPEPEENTSCNNVHCSCKGAHKEHRKLAWDEFTGHTPRKYSKQGRDDRSKDRRLRMKGSGLTRAKTVELDPREFAALFGECQPYNS